MRPIDADLLKAELRKLPMMSNWGESMMPALIDQQPTLGLVTVDAQKKRPLTYAEAAEYLNNGDPVWCEERHETFQKNRWYMPVGINCTLLDEEQYGVTWRCWACRPTAEERKAAEWFAGRGHE